MWQPLKPLSFEYKPGWWPVATREVGAYSASVYVCCFGETVVTPGTQRRAGSRDLPLQSSGTYNWQPLEREVTLSFVDCHARVTLSLILQTQAI